MSVEGLDPDERETLESFVGKRLVSFSKEKNRGDFDRGRWCDDEPVNLTFADGSILVFYASGWHDSGGLHVGSEAAPAPKP